MANLWGRESEHQFGAKRRSAVPIIFLMIACLVLGAGAGYFSSRFLTPETIVAAPAPNTAELEALQAKVLRQANELDAMAEKLSAQSAQPAQADNSQSLMAEIEALKRERDSIALKNEDLAKKLQFAEADSAQLAKELKQATVSSEAELNDFRNTIVPQLMSEQKELVQQITRLEAQNRDLEAKVKIKTTADQDVAEKARLEQISALQKQLDAAMQDLKSTRQALGDAEARLAEALAEQTPPPSPAPAETAEVAEKPVADQAETSVPRSKDEVAQALRSATGLSALSGADRDVLTRRLEKGECVTSALEAVFDRVPVLALRDLIRELNSDC